MAVMLEKCAQSAGGSRPARTSRGATGDILLMDATPTGRPNVGAKLLGGSGNAPPILAHLGRRSTCTRPPASRVSFSDLLCAPPIPARHGPADPLPRSPAEPRLRLRRAAPRRRAGQVTNQRGGGPDPTPRFTFRNDRNSGTVRHRSTRGLRLVPPNWGIHGRRASTSGDGSAASSRPGADRLGDCRQTPKQERRRAAGCGARGLVHLGQGAKPHCGVRAAGAA